MSRILTVGMRAYGEFPTRIVNFINIASVLLILATVSRTNIAGNLHGNFIKSVHFVGNLNKLTMSLAIFVIDEHYLQDGYNRYIMLFLCNVSLVCFSTISCICCV